MGCCGSRVPTGEEDTLDAAPLNALENRLWAELEELSFASSADTADEPSNCAMGIRQYAITVHAKFAYGVTGTMDTTPDGKVYEAVEEPVLRPKQVKRIEDWLRHVRPPASKREQFVDASVTMQSSNNSDSGSDRESVGVTAGGGGGRRRQTGGGGGGGGSGVYSASGRGDPPDFDGYGEPPRIGDLASSSDDRSR